MGAGIAFELTRWLRSRGLSPDSLIVSGARAPQYRVSPASTPEPDDQELIDNLRRLGGIPGDVLDSPAMLAMLLPVLKADLRLYRNYTWRPEPPLAVPLFAYSGDADPNLSAAQLQEWREHTTAPFTTRVFSGGHFYFNSNLPEFLAALNEDLAGAPAEVA
jgi:medium-chain acyl-[acyl-carrier-protein] hydrolase